MAAVAYVDPGNFAANTSAGAMFGYRLAFVVVLASLLAMPVQFLSAKVGIVTGQSLPRLCRDWYRPAVVRGLWLQAELVAMATDLAEVVGAARSRRRPGGGQHRRGDHHAARRLPSFGPDRRADPLPQ